MPKKNIHINFLCAVAMQMNLLIYNDYLPKSGNFTLVLMPATPRVEGISILIWSSWEMLSSHIFHSLICLWEINWINLHSQHVILKHTLNKVLPGHKDKQLSGQTLSKSFHFSSRSFWAQRKAFRAGRKKDGHSYCKGQTNQHDVSSCSRKLTIKKSFMLGWYFTT